MMLVPCPWCGPRNVSEFAYGGEALRRPDVGTADPLEWRTYLYTRDNPCGWVRETWYHRFGCRRYITVERHTLTNEVRAASVPGQEPGQGVPP
jgi:sarcosine oxidase, subunit delta